MGFPEMDPNWPVGGDSAGEIGAVIRIREVIAAENRAVTE